MTPRPEASRLAGSDFAALLQLVALQCTTPTAALWLRAGAFDGLPILHSIGMDDSTNQTVSAAMARAFANPLTHLEPQHFAADLDAAVQPAMECVMAWVYGTDNIPVGALLVLIAAINQATLATAPARLSNSADETIRRAQATNLSRFTPVAASLIGQAHLLTTQIVQLQTTSELAERQIELLRCSSRSARVGGWRVEFPSLRLYWTDEVAEIHGVVGPYPTTVEDALLFFAPEHRSIVESSFKDCARDGTAFDIEAELVPEKGPRIWIRSMGQAVRNASGRTLHVQGSIQDITERKLAQLAERQTEERFMLVARATTDTVWDWNLLDDTVWWSEGMQTQFGIPPNALDNSVAAWSSRLHPQDHDRVVRSTYASIEGTGSEWSETYRFSRHDGSYADVIDRGFVLRNALGRAVRMVGGMSDVTKLRLADEEAQREAYIRVEIVRAQQRIASMDVDLPSAMEMIAETAQRLTHASGSIVELFENNELTLRASVGMDLLVRGCSTSLDSTISGLVIATGEIQRCDDALTDIRVDQEGCLRLGVRSVMASPLRSNGQVIGVLKVLSPQPNAFAHFNGAGFQILSESLGATIERHRIAQLLQLSEQQYRMLFKNNPQPMWVYSIDNMRLLAVNRSMAAHYGYTEAELLKMRLPELWLPDDEIIMQDLARSISPDELVFGLVRKHLRKDRSVIDMELSASGILFDGIPARLVLGTDITERLRADNELACLNRAQRMLSAANEALVRAESEAVLLDEICRIAAEIGGYHMAWVGIAHDDAAHSIETVAHAGASRAYLAEIQISWSDELAIGQGPVGRTIRTGQPVVVNDVLRDATFKPWISATQEYGIRGIICLPLSHAESTFGLFCLYTSTVLDISDEEVTLLQDMANDLAFGVVNIRAQNEQRRVQAAVMKVAEAVSASDSSEFFEQLVLNMTIALDACAGCVARLGYSTAESLAYPLAHVVDGVLVDLENYPLQNTPFGMLTDNRRQVVANRVIQQYPQVQMFADLQARSFAGQLLHDAAGKTIGMIFLVFRDKLEQPDFTLSTLQIFATRAAAEMGQQQADAHIRSQAALLDKAQDAIIVRDMQHHISYWNRGAERLYGLTSQQALGTSVAELMHEDQSAFDAACQAVMTEGEWHGEIAQRRHDGQPVTVESRWTLVRDDRGAPQSILTINTDISHRKATEREIQKLAFYDALTGLPNRMLLVDRLQHALAATTRSGRGGALLFIDLDNFKTINDTLGHDKGDLLLQQAAMRLQENVREADTVARLGGDEFVVMLEDLSSDPNELALQARAVGEKILIALSTPYLLDNCPHQSSSSIGVAPFADQNESVNDLLKHADLAMYQAKTAGRNTLRFFDPAMQAVVSARAALEIDLRLALTGNELLLHYQPQINIDNQIVGVEALVRWKHPRRGMVSPVDFIPLAEETGMVVQLGRWVLQTACAQLAKWSHDPSTASLTIAVNVSSREFSDPGFVEQVAEVLRRTGADPQRLKLELTESLLIADVADTVEKMTALKTQGVCFSLDDFGTGYSSLSYLKRLPLDQLKIDQSFVRDIQTDPNDTVIVRTIIGLGQSLGLDVIAEGVETAGQRSLLAREGCTAYQGYLFSRPLPLELFEPFLQAHLEALRGAQPAELADGGNWPSLGGWVGSI